MMVRGVILAKKNDASRIIFEASFSFLALTCGEEALFSLGLVIYREFSLAKTL